MKATFFTLAATCIAATQAFVVTLWTEPNCGGAAASRNVYDNTCAYTGGYQSYEITTGGADGQQLTAYSPNACAGAITSQTCGTSSTGCINTNGGSNAITSYYANACVFGAQDL